MIRRGNKYGAKRTILFPGGRSYDSKLEAERGRELELMQAAGEISDLQCQVVVRLADAVNYRADFRYAEQPGGRLVHEEVKGFESERWRVVQKLWRRHGPTLLRITKRRGKSIVVAREILPKALP